MLKVEKERLSTPHRVQISDPDEGSGGMAVAQHLQRGVPHAQWILSRSLPIRVLIFQRRENLVEVVIVRVSNVRPQDAVASSFVEAELEVLSVEV